MTEINQNNPVPRLRQDLSLNAVKENGQEFVVLNDLERIAPQNIAVSMQMFYVLQALDGKMTWSQFRETLMKETGGSNEIAEIIIENIIQLYKHNFLETEEYVAQKQKMINDYLAIPERPPVCAGSTYPNEKSELEAMLDNFFSTVKKEEIKPGAKSIIVPHIDFKIGTDVYRTYAAGYHSLRDTDADLFVIFGTSHYAHSDYFMLSEKDYSSPLGTLKTDTEIIEKLKNEYKNLKIDELAHKNEHSIELQAVLLQHYFRGKDFKILPVLVGSFHEFIENGKSPDTAVKSFLDALNKVISENNIKAAFISSVDFAHIGKKFGDTFDAEEKLDELISVDKNLIESLTDNDYNGFFQKIKNDNDKWKVCGTSPMYSMLSSQNGYKGELLQYGQWYEKPTQSAVSFASIAYYENNRDKK